MADITPPCEARQRKPKRGVASTQRTSVKVHQDEAFHGWRVEPETVEGRSHGVKWTLEKQAGESRVCRCRIVWRRPGKQRWDEKPLNEMNGEPWNTAHSDTKIMPQIRPTWYGREMRGKRNSCRGMRWSLQGSERMSNSKHVDDMVRIWRLKLESKETPTPITKPTGRRRDIDETLMQHDVRASREAAGTSSPAVKSSIQQGAWLCRRQANPKALRACQNTPRPAEDLTKETVLSIVGEQAVLRCEAIADQTDTLKVRVTRHCQIASSWSVRVASLGNTQVAASERVQVAPRKE